MKSFKQFCIEADFNQAREVANNEINFVHNLNRPQGPLSTPGYKYAGRRAPDRNNPGKEVPQEVRHAQDLRAAQERSRQRQGK